MQWPTTSIQCILCCIFSSHSKCTCFVYLRAFVTSHYHYCSFVESGRDIPVIHDECNTWPLKVSKYVKICRKSNIANYIFYKSLRTYQLLVMITSFIKSTKIIKILQPIAVGLASRFDQYKILVRIKFKLHVWWRIYQSVPYAIKQKALRIPKQIPKKAVKYLC